MEKILDHIKYSIVNNIKAELETDENDLPFAYISDESRDKTAESFLNFLCTTINNYNKFVVNHRKDLRDYLDSQNFPFESNEEKDNLNKIKLCFEYYFKNEDKLSE